MSKVWKPIREMPEPIHTVSGRLKNNVLTDPAYPKTQALVRRLMSAFLPGWMWDRTRRQARAHPRHYGASFTWFEPAVEPWRGLEGRPAYWTGGSWWTLTEGTANEIFRDGKVVGTSYTPWLDDPKLWLDQLRGKVVLGPRWVEDDVHEIDALLIDVDLENIVGYGGTLVGRPMAYVATTDAALWAWRDTADDLELDLGDPAFFLSGGNGFWVCAWWDADLPVSVLQELKARWARNFRVRCSMPVEVKGDPSTYLEQEERMQEHVVVDYGNLEQRACRVPGGVHQCGEVSRFINPENGEEISFVDAVMGLEGKRLSARGLLAKLDPKVLPAEEKTIYKSDIVGDAEGDQPARECGNDSRSAGVEVDWVPTDSYSRDNAERHRWLVTYSEILACEVVVKTSPLPPLPVIREDRFENLRKVGARLSVAHLLARGVPRSRIDERMVLEEFGDKLQWNESDLRGWKKMLRTQITHTAESGSARRMVGLVPEEWLRAEELADRVYGELRRGQGYSREDVKRLIVVLMHESARHHGLSFILPLRDMLVMIERHPRGTPNDGFGGDPKSLSRLLRRIPGLEIVERDDRGGNRYRLREEPTSKGASEQGAGGLGGLR